MSFEYPPGSLWTPKSAVQHAADILDRINAVLLANHVLDGNGNQVVLQANFSNAIWIICLGVGAMRAQDDLAMLAAAESFSVSEASDTQIQEVLPIAGTSLIPGAYSLLTISVTAGSNPATVTAGSKVPFASVCNFVVLADTVVPANTTVDILTQSDTLGPIDVPIGGVNGFLTPIANVASVTNSVPSIQGRDTETIQEIRQRILKGRIDDIGLDGTERAILSIQGITSAKMYFNFDTQNALALPGGVLLPPRTAYIVVLGSDITGEAIANAYVARMSAPTMSLANTYQVYVTLGGQSFQVYYDVATPQRVFVKYFYDADTVTASGFVSSLAEIAANQSNEIGGRLTAVQLGSAVKDFPYALITDVQISFDGLTWTSELEIPANSYVSIDVDDVQAVPQT